VDLSVERFRKPNFSSGITMSLMGIENYGFEVVGGGFSAGLLGC
jgi:hypothetical protein